MIFMQELRRICDKYGILLVADEVQSGSRRTGKWWAIEHTGVEPDIVCMAKGIASGMPLGVCMARAGDHGLGARLMLPPSAAKPGVDRGRVGYDGYSGTRRRASPNAAKIGEELLTPAFVIEPAKHAIVGDIRGRGRMIGIEIVKDQTSREVAGPWRDRIVELAFERGLLILGCGESSIRLAPSTHRQHLPCGSDRFRHS